MLRTLLSCIGIGLVLASVQSAKPQSSSSATGPLSPSREFLAHYCVTCHNEKLKTADVTLDQVDVRNVGQAPELWEDVARKLRRGEMPPAGAPRPNQAIRDTFATYLETELDRAAAAKPDPGRPVAVHRLTRAEYANAVRDLLGVDIDTEALFPPEAVISGYGFDNIGEVLSMSPMLMERYISVAELIKRLAIGDVSIQPSTSTYEIPASLHQDDRMSEDLPFGSRGGIAIRYRFPVDAEYVINIRLKTDAEDGVIGDLEPHRLDVRLDGAKIKEFTVGGGQTDVQIGETDRDLTFRFRAEAGARAVGISFLNEPADPEAIVLPPLGTLSPDSLADGLAAVGSVVIEGPYDATGSGNTLSRQKIFGCRPAGGADDEPCARRILSTLARRAYRRPVTRSDIEALMDLYRPGRSQGFEAGIGLALEGMLVSREFLFRVEPDPPNSPPDKPYLVSDLELASRLSFFLWSSIPDDELIALAERHKLRNSGVLEQQVRRMLADSRAKALVDNFAGQWLRLRSLRSLSPDADTYPEFDSNLRDAFAQEMNLFFESMLREDHSVLDLLNANYTFVNERLARHYGIPNIHGSRFRRVTLTDEARMGLLGKGGILTVTSYANRTSPVLRGKYILEKILGTPPAPPPPNIPPLKEATPGTALTVRQLVEQHRSNPACASCHLRMDPLGFALENFDGIGKWRNTEADIPIDASGSLPDGARFQGPAELRAVLVGKPAAFAAVITERLLTYALGRGVEYYDQPAVRKILREASSGGYRWSSLILGVVNSMPFQMRKSAAGPAATARGAGKTPLALKSGN